MDGKREDNRKKGPGVNSSGVKKPARKKKSSKVSPAMQAQWAKWGQASSSDPSSKPRAKKQRSSTNFSSVHTPSLMAASDSSRRGFGERLAFEDRGNFHDNSLPRNRQELIGLLQQGIGEFEQLSSGMRAKVGAMMALGDTFRWLCITGASWHRLGDFQKGTLRRANVSTQTLEQLGADASNNSPDLLDRARIAGNLVRHGAASKGSETQSINNRFDQSLVPTLQNTFNFNQSTEESIVTQIEVIQDSGKLRLYPYLEQLKFVYDTAKQMLRNLTQSQSASGPSTNTTSSGPSYQFQQQPSSTTPSAPPLSPRHSQEAPFYPPGLPLSQSKPTASPTTPQFSQYNPHQQQYQSPRFSSGELQPPPQKAPTPHPPMVPHFPQHPSPQQSYPQPAFTPHYPPYHPSYQGPSPSPHPYPPPQFNPVAPPMSSQQSSQYSQSGPSFGPPSYPQPTQRQCPNCQKLNYVNAPGCSACGMPFHY